jgi:tyrosyl-DNA phosphodiesterase-1
LHASTVTAQKAEATEQISEDGGSRLAESSAKQTGGKSIPSQNGTSSQSTAAAPYGLTPPLPPILGDRAAMEKERLERQAARLASSGKGYSVVKMPAPSTHRPSGTGGIISLGDIAARSGSSHTTTGAPSSKKSDHPLRSRGPFPADAGGEYYLDGEMRHTSLSIGNPATEPTFGPADVIGRVSDGLPS